ncbi:MAG: CHAD domain-containing protein [Gallionellaceae bacterium]
MAVEIELKLSLPPECLDRLKRNPLLKSPAGSRAVTRKLYNIYYDTPGLDLRRNALALRLRRVGKQWLQTLKGGGSVQTGLHQRDEWEMPVPRKALDLDALGAAGGRLPQGVSEKLQPLFVTDFARNLRLLKFGGAKIELSLDSGTIRAGRRSHRISELELELKSGEPRQLFRFALALLDSVPLEVEPTSKPEHGYQLLHNEPLAASKASFPSLTATQSIASALHAMTGACLQHVQANVPGAIHSRDEEFLHQVRVGMRRLRVVLAMAEAFRADDELHALHDQVAQMCIEFGGLREWDVFTTQTLAPVCSRQPDNDGLSELLAASEKERARYRAGVVRKLRSQDYQRFLLRFGASMFGDYWHEPPDAPGTALADFAVQNLDKRRRQAHKLGKILATADPGQLHRLRIACKKLRYSSEMFGSLFEATGVKPYVDALSELQDILGVLNDLAVAHRLLEGLENRRRHDTLELVRGRIAHDRAELVTKLAEAWPRFAEQKEFWK